MHLAIRAPWLVQISELSTHTTELFHCILVNSNEFKRWLAKQGATFQPGKGSHLKVFLNRRQSVLPMHASDLKTGLVEAIKKQLGLK